MSNDWIPPDLMDLQWRHHTQERVPAPSHTPHREQPSNHFSQATRGDFGQFFDFEVKDYPNNRKIFMAHSQAAIWWCWDRFHDSMDTVEGPGWILSAREIGWIKQDAERAGLVDKEDALNEQENTRRQWD